jgi:hypothetical protein
MQINRKKHQCHKQDLVQCKKNSETLVAIKFQSIDKSDEQFSCMSLQTDTAIDYHNSNDGCFPHQVGSHLFLLVVVALVDFL